MLISHKIIIGIWIVYLLILIWVGIDLFIISKDPMALAALLLIGVMMFLPALGASAFMLMIGRVETEYVPIQKE